MSEYRDPVVNRHSRLRRRSRFCRVTTWANNLGQQYPLTIVYNFYFSVTNVENYILTVTYC